MADLQGLCFFPGIQWINRATMSVIRGITPSVCTIEMLPQDNLIAEAGTLVFQFGDTKLVWQDCKVDWASLRMSSNGFTWVVSILDRRWKWRFGEISGEYNVWRDDFTLHDGKVDPQSNNTQLRVIDTTRTPKELAKLLLEAMGESKYDISSLPDEPRPEVAWDRDNPAQELANLCDLLGCYVVLRMDNTVAIVPGDKGADLPTDGVLTPSFSIDAPETPSAVGVICGPTRFQVDFDLEAVGLDAPDIGTVLPEQKYEPSHTLLKPIGDLSYVLDPFDTEAGGFTLGDLDYFMNVANDGIGLADEVSGLRELAVKSVFKYYRLKVPVTIPGYGKVEKLEQIVLEPEQVKCWWMQYELINLPADVYGIYCDDLGAVYTNNVPKLTTAPVFAQKKPPFTRDIFYKKGFQIDTNLHLVIFNKAVYMNREVGENPSKTTIGPAKLRLRAACSIRDPKTLGLVRYKRERKTGAKFNTKTEWIRRDEIVLSYIGKQNNKAKGWHAAAGGVDKMCDHYIDQAMRKYRFNDAQQMTYMGLRKIELDGFVAQVAYSVSNSSGATTEAARNSELLQYAPGYRERRRVEQSRKAVERTADPWATRRALLRWAKGGPKV